MAGKQEATMNDETLEAEKKLLTEELADKIVEGVRDSLAKRFSKSETSKFRHLSEPFCRGVGLDIGASGDPVVRTAICCDLPQPYCPPLGPAPTHIPVDGRKVHQFFRLLSLDYVYSSHLLEDFAPAEWQGIVLNWSDLVKPGGYLVILVPEVDLWKRALDRGQPPNLAHKHEFRIGELSTLFDSNTDISGLWTVVIETIPDPEDYSILFVARRNRT